MDWKRKLSSRKLWAAVVGLIVGIAAAFGIRENEWAQAAGVVTTAVSVISYITGEAMVDAAAASGTVTIVEAADAAEEEFTFTDAAV